MKKLVLLVTYKLKEDAHEEFLAEIYASGFPEKVREEDGCLRYEYYFDAEAPETILLVEEWESEAQQKKHLETEHMKNFREIKEMYVEETVIEKLYKE